MEEYMRIVGKSRIPCISSINQMQLIYEIVDPYFKDTITLDEMIQQLTEKTEMMLR